MKARKVVAELRIFHGTRIQPPITLASKHPLLISIHRGKRTVRSFAALIELAVALVPTVARDQARAAKKAAHLPPEPSSSHNVMISNGFQR